MYRKQRQSDQCSVEATARYGASEQKQISITAASTYIGMNVWLCFLACTLMCMPAVCQTGATFATRPPIQSPVDIQAQTDIMDLANKIETATVRGDVAYVDSVTSPDFTMIHGAGWTEGGKVAGADNKAAYLKRVADKEYPVHDMDPSSIHFEMHGDVVITYGRYVSLFMPANRNAAMPVSLSSIWFERVYQKQNGKWMYLSHRSVRVAPSPAGIDPGAVTSVTLNIQASGLSQAGIFQFEGNGTDKGLTLPAVMRPGSGAPRGAAANGTSGGFIEPPTDNSPEAREVLALEKKIGDSIVSGDAAFFDSVTAPDFEMTHGNIWTRGGIPTLVDNKQTFLQRVQNKTYFAFITDEKTQKIEMHGNVAVTFGRYIAAVHGWDPNTAWFSCWYERVFEKRDGKWVYLSHRTVHDPARGPTRESVSDK